MQLPSVRGENLWEFCVFGIAVLRPYGTKFMDQPWRSRGGDSLSLGWSRKGAQIPDLTEQEEAGQAADGPCSLSTAYSQASGAGNLHSSGSRLSQ